VVSRHLLRFDGPAGWTMADLLRKLDHVEALPSE
jgi:hypothetical protein